MAQFVEMGMELGMAWVGPLIGLVGWAATSFALMRAPQLTTIQKHAISVLAWMLWMFPAFNTLAHQGIMNTDAALQFCSGLTIVVSTLVFISAMRQRSRS